MFKDGYVKPVTLDDVNVWLAQKSLPQIDDLATKDCVHNKWEHPGNLQTKSPLSLVIFPDGDVPGRQSPDFDAWIMEQLSQSPIWWSLSLQAAEDPNTCHFRKVVCIFSFTL